MNSKELNLHFDSFNLDNSNDILKLGNNDNNNNNNNFMQQDTSTDFLNLLDASTFNHRGSYTVPQLSPDAQENSFTSSSVLSGYNPEFNMSPLQIATTTNAQTNIINTPLMQTYHTPLQQPKMNNPLEDFTDDEEYFTPLVSPAIPPTYNDANYQSFGLNNQSFSPLSSPALNPVSGEQNALQQKLAFIERQQQHLRNIHHQLRPNTTPKNGGYTSPLATYSNKFQQPKASPQFNRTPTFAIPLSPAIKSTPPEKKPNTTTTTNNDFIAPATPSLLMKLGNGGTSPSSLPTASSSAVDNMPTLPEAILNNNKPEEPKKPIKRRKLDVRESPKVGPKSQLISPRALVPLISPSLKPNGRTALPTIDEEAARTLLTTKSNYENLKEGKAKSLGIDFPITIQSGIENRRSAHKAAEQKRRDTLKQSFDALRSEILDVMVDQDETDMEKDQVRSIKEKDVKQMSKVVLLQHSYEYILKLKTDNRNKDEKMHKMQEELLSLRQKLGLPEVTKEEKEQEEKALQDEKERKEASMKRLKDLQESTLNDDDV